MHISYAQWLAISIALACAAIQTLILRNLAKNSLRSDFRVFFMYNAAFVVANVAAIVPFLYFCPQYFYIYWTLNVLLMGMEFVVLFEAVVHALKPYSALIDLGKILFCWAAVFLLLAGLLTAVTTTGSGSSRAVAAVEIMQRSMRLMQCGLLLLFFSFEKRLGLSWRSYSMSIALGFGIYSATDLSTSYLGSQFPGAAWMLATSANVVYLAAASYWAYCFARREPAHKNVLDSPSKLIFQRWDEALASYGYGSSPSTVESFLPGIEKTVDRVMARRVS